VLRKTEQPDQDANAMHKQIPRAARKQGFAPFAED
jgi:hypothetical protein